MCAGSVKSYVRGSSSTRHKAVDFDRHAFLSTLPKSQDVLVKSKHLQAQGRKITRRWLRSSEKVRRTTAIVYGYSVTDHSAGDQDLSMEIVPLDTSRDSRGSFGRGIPLIVVHLIR